MRTNTKVVWEMLTFICQVYERVILVEINDKKLGNFNREEILVKHTSNISRGNPEVDRSELCT